MNFPFKV